MHIDAKISEPIKRSGSKQISAAKNTKLKIWKMKIKNLKAFGNAVRRRK